MLRQQPFNSRIASASSSASAEVSTRNAMFQAHLTKELRGRASAAGFYVFVPSADAFNGLLKVLAFPFQVSCQSVIQRSRSILAATPGVFFQLCLTFRFERYHLHGGLVLLTWLHRRT